MFRGQSGGFLKFPTQCGGSTKWRPAEEIQNVFLFFVYLVGHQNSVALKCFLIVDDEDTKLESNCLKNSSAPSSSKCRVDDCEGFDSFSYLNVDVKVRHLEIWCSCFMRWS